MDREDERLRRYLEDEAMGSGGAQAPARGRAAPLDAASAMGFGAHVAPPGPGGMAPPTGTRPSPRPSMFPSQQDVARAFSDQQLSARPSPTAPTGPMGARDPRLPDSMTGAGAAAAGGGAGAAIAPIAGVVMSYLQKQQEANALRRGAREGIQQDYVSSLGYPTYGIQAASAKRQARDLEGPDYLRYLLPFMGGAG